jgi:hypothetical protein
MRRIVVLAEAAEDLEEARRFYDEREAGVGDYCVTSLLTDLASLALFRGIHRKQWAVSGCWPAAFLSAFTTWIQSLRPASSLCWTCGWIQVGFADK